MANPSAIERLLGSDKIRDARIVDRALSHRGLDQAGRQRVEPDAFLRVASGSIEASIAVPIADTAMLLVTAVGAIVFFQETVTVQKLAGLALLVAGIALLRPA